MANLLATKPIKTILDEAHETGEHSLKRALGPSNLIALGIGAIIGTGIFVITGTATAQHAGPAMKFEHRNNPFGFVSRGRFLIWRRSPDGLRREVVITFIGWIWP